MLTVWIMIISTSGVSISVEIENSYSLCVMNVQNRKSQIFQTITKPMIYTRSDSRYLSD